MVTIEERFKAVCDKNWAQRELIGKLHKNLEDAHSRLSTINGHVERKPKVAAHHVELTVEVLEKCLAALEKANT